MKNRANAAVGNAEKVRGDKEQSISKLPSVTPGSHVAMFAFLLNRIFPKGPFAKNLLLICGPRQ